MYTVKAYRDHKSLRITVPKAYVVTFATLCEQAGGGPVPKLVCFTTYRDLSMREPVERSKGIVEPYFSNCDFGLKLYVKQDHAYSSDLRRFGKGRFGFVIDRELAQRLSLTENAKLTCQILDDTRPQEGFYSKIIGYTVQRRKYSSHGVDM